MWCRIKSNQMASGDNGAFMMVPAGSGFEKMPVILQNPLRAARRRLCPSYSCRYVRDVDSSVRRFSGFACQGTARGNDEAKVGIFFRYANYFCLFFKNLHFNYFRRIFAPVFRGGEGLSLFLKLFIACILCLDFAGIARAVAYAVAHGVGRCLMDAAWRVAWRHGGATSAATSARSGDGRGLCGHSRAPLVNPLKFPYFCRLSDMPIN